MTITSNFGTENCCKFKTKNIPNTSILFNLKSIPLSKYNSSLEDRLSEILISFECECEEIPVKLFKLIINSSPLEFEEKQHPYLFFLRNEPKFLDAIFSIPISQDSKRYDSELTHIDNFWIRYDKEKKYSPIANSKYLAELFSKFLEGKDSETHDHNLRVGLMNSFITQEFYNYCVINKNNHEIIPILESNPSYLTYINHGGILHDLGKMFIPQKILFNPNSLTDEERQKIKMHTEFGGKLLSNLVSNKLAKEIAQYHHEKYDGSGYHKLAKKEIPLSARISTFSDILDAMNSKRAYKEAYTYSEIHDYFYNDKEDKKGGFQGTFDPVILEFSRKNWDRICEYHFQLKLDYPN